MVSKIWVGMSSTNIHYSTSKFKVTCKNADFESEALNAGTCISNLILTEKNRVQVDIQKGIVPKGVYSKRFLFWKIIIPKILSQRAINLIITKIFIPKGLYSENFHPEGSFFPNFGITTLRDKNLLNNDPLEWKSSE